MKKVCEFLHLDMFDTTDEDDGGVMAPLSVTTPPDTSPPLRSRHEFAKDQFKPPNSKLPLGPLSLNILNNNRGLKRSFRRSPSPKIRLKRSSKRSPSPEIRLKRSTKRSPTPKRSRSRKIPRVEWNDPGKENELEKYFLNEFDKSMDTSLWKKISVLEKENKKLLKDLKEKDVIIEDLEKNNEKLLKERGLWKEMEIDAIECSSPECREKFRSNELLRRHLRFECKFKA